MNYRVLMVAVLLGCAQAGFAEEVATGSGQQTDVQQPDQGNRAPDAAKTGDTATSPAPNDKPAEPAAGDPGCD